MARAAEGTCPDCGGTLGIRVSDSIAVLAGSQIERMMDRDGNAVRCTTCDEYKSPDDMSLVD